MLTLLMTPELQAKSQKAATTKRSSDQTGMTNLIHEHGSELQLLSQANISVTKLELPNPHRMRPAPHSCHPTRMGKNRSSTRVSLLRSSRSYYNVEMIKHLPDAAKSNEG